jgi:hypothetical protein
LASLTRTSRRTQRRLAEAAAPFIEPGESIQIALFAQDTPVRGQPLLLMSLLKQVGFLVLGATQRHIYVFSRGFLCNAKLRGVIRRYPLASTSVAFRRSWGELDIDVDRYWIAAFAAQGDAQDFVAFVQKGHL